MTSKKYKIIYKSNTTTYYFSNNMTFSSKKSNIFQTSDKNEITKIYSSILDNKTELFSFDPSNKNLKILDNLEKQYSVNYVKNQYKSYLKQNTIDPKYTILIISKKKRHYYLSKNNGLLSERNKNLKTFNDLESAKKELSKLKKNVTFKNSWIISYKTENIIYPKKIKNIPDYMLNDLQIASKLAYMSYSYKIGKYKLLHLKGATLIDYWHMIELKTDPDKEKIIQDMKSLYIQKNNLENNLAQKNKLRSFINFDNLKSELKDYLDDLENRSYEYKDKNVAKRYSSGKHLY